MAENQIATLAKLAGTLNHLAGVLEAYKDVDADESWADVGFDPMRRPPARGAKYAIENVRKAVRTIGEAQDLAKALPAAPEMREVKEALSLAFNAIGQADVPAEMELLKRHEKKAIACARDGIKRAFDKCGKQLERLGARVSVMADEASEPQRRIAGLESIFEFM